GGRNSGFRRGNRFRSNDHGSGGALWPRTHQAREIQQDVDPERHLRQGVLPEIPGLHGGWRAQARRLYAGLLAQASSAAAQRCSAAAATEPVTRQPAEAVSESARSRSLVRRKSRLSAPMRSEERRVGKESRW